jgi:hypothetical protein
MCEFASRVSLVLLGHELTTSVSFSFSFPVYASMRHRRRLRGGCDSSRAGGAGGGGATGVMSSSRGLLCSDLPFCREHRHQKWPKLATILRQAQLLIVIIFPSAAISTLASTTHGSSGHGGQSGIGPWKRLSRSGGVVCESGQ